MESKINQIILNYFPKAQAIYLFGTFGTADEWKNSDVDIALLLEHNKAKTTKYLLMSDLSTDLEYLLKKKVDLINLRHVSTVLQKEVLLADRRIYCGEEYAADEFEMLVISYYQKLNEERAEIINEAINCGSFYNL